MPRLQSWRSTRAVVTGAACGLGRALALELARRGARVIASDVAFEGAQETAALARTLGAEAWAFRCDVTRIDDLHALAKEADARLGGVDLAVNNAGVGVAGRTGEVPLEDWSWILDVNLRGTIHGCHVFAPRMRAQGSGFILNVASMAGLVASPEMAPYNVTKAGVVALTETLHQELSPHGVGVTVLCPMVFRSSFIRGARNHDPAMTCLGERLVARSRLTAEVVARIGLDAVAAGRLYALTGADARWLWRLKRLMPEAFHASVAPTLMRFVARRARLPTHLGRRGHLGR